MSKFFRNSLLSSAARFVDMAFPIVSIPILLSTFGVDNYAVLISTMALISPLQPMLNLAIDDVFQRLQLERGLDEALLYAQVLIRVRLMLLGLFVLASLAFGSAYLTLAVLSLVAEVFSAHTYFIASNQVRYFLLSKIINKLLLLLAIIFVLPFHISLESYFGLLIFSNLVFAALLWRKLKTKKDQERVTFNRIKSCLPILANSLYLVANNFVANVRDKFPIAIVSTFSPTLAVTLDIIHKGILAINSVSSAFVLTAFATVDTLNEIYKFRPLLLTYSALSLLAAAIFFAVGDLSVSLGGYEIKASFASLALVASTLYLYSIIVVKTYMIPRNLYFSILVISIILAALSNGFATLFGDSGVVVLMPMIVFGSEFLLRTFVVAWDVRRT